VFERDRPGLVRRGDDQDRPAGGRGVRPEHGDCVEEGRVRDVPVDHDQVIATGERVREQFTELLRRVIPRL